MSTMEAVTKTREVDDGRIDFEEAPRGSLTADGQERDRDWRAYFWTPSGPCPACEGTGREPGAREGTTRKCAACQGSGEPKRQRMTSVTTILDAITAKGGLPPWAEAKGIEGLLKAIQLGFVDPATITGPEAVERVRGLRLGADAARDEAADRGTFSVHAPLEHYMRTGESPSIADYPPEHAGYVQALCRWLLFADPEPEQVEEMVCHPEYGYAGRSDLVARGSGLRTRWDYKSQGRGQVFEGLHVQLRLYEMAAVRGGDEPCDLLQGVVLAENGEFAVMACAADEAAALAALAWYSALRPIASVCAAHNKLAREARR